MAKQEQDQAVSKNVIDSATIQLEEGVGIPAQVKESKYPWHELIQGSDVPPEKRKNFFVPCANEDEAKTTRPSIHSSGTNYYAKRGLPLKPITRVMQNNAGAWGIRAWAAPRAE